MKILKFFRWFFKGGIKKKEKISFLDPALFKIVKNDKTKRFEVIMDGKKIAEETNLEAAVSVFESNIGWFVNEERLRRGER